MFEACRCRPDHHLLRQACRRASRQEPDFCLCRRQLSRRGSVVSSTSSFTNMSIQLIGVSYARTPVALREKFAIPEVRLREAMEDLMQWPGVSEGMLLSTCNRVEVLANTRDDTTDLRAFLSPWAGVQRSELDPHIYECREEEAVRHL